MKNFILQFQANHERVTNYLGPSTEIELTIALASKYTLASQQYSGLAFQQVVDQLQQKLSEQKGYRSSIDFSNLSTKLYKVAAHLHVNQLNETKLLKYLENDRRLDEVGFKSGVARVIGALILSENVSHETIAKNLYDEIQKTQQILTAKINIPYAVLVAKNGLNNISERVNIINQYYEELVKKQFKKGNNLYALSNTLSLYDEAFHPELVERVKNLREAFKKRNITVKKMHYPYLGVVAAISEQPGVVNKISEAYQELIQTNIMKYHRDLALVVAIQFVVKRLIEIEEVLLIKETSQVLEIMEVSELTFMTSIGLLENITGVVSEFIN